MSRRFNLYLGKAGQMVAMSEFLARGWNAAIPEVDVGDDLFIVRDRDGELHRIQVKTASAVRTGRGFTGQFSIRHAQLAKPTPDNLTYVFVLRRGEAWHGFFVIDRKTLHAAVEEGRVGSKTNGTVTILLKFSRGRVSGKGNADLSQFLNNWARWEPIAH